MCKIIPIRLIPVDFGYQIDNITIKKIVKYCLHNHYTTNENVLILGDNILLQISILENLVLNIFKDGIGVFVFYDEINSYTNLRQIDSLALLKKRGQAHKDILDNSHYICEALNKITRFIRNLKRNKLRRLTSFENWENGGFSYVMSTYYFDQK